MLVHPNEHGMLVMNEDEEKNIVVKRGNINNDMNGEKDIGNMGSNNNDEISARTAAQYSRCRRTDKGVHAHGQAR